MRSRVCRAARHVRMCLCPLCLCPCLSVSAVPVRVRCARARARFVQLVWKLLHGSDSVLELLDVDAYPFKARPPTQLRASLYHYDFTRLHSPWAKNIPGCA